MGHPATTALAASVEVATTLAATLAAAATAFAVPSDWKPSVGDVVRLAPGLGEKNGLRQGELATVRRVYPDGDRALTRCRVGKELSGYFEPRDLRHRFEGWLPLHAGAALNLAPEVLRALLAPSLPFQSQRLRQILLIRERTLKKKHFKS